MQAFNMSRKSYFRNASLFLMLLTLLFMQPGLCEDKETSTVLRSRVFKFKHITSQQAKEMLSQLGIGKGYNPLTDDVLIVTSNDGSDLMKATEFYNLVEQIPSPHIRVLLSGTQSQQFSLDDFVSSLDTVTVGTLTDAPAAGAVNPAVVDILSEGQLVAISNLKSLDEIQNALADYLREKQPTQEPAQTEQAAASATAAHPVIEAGTPEIMQAAETPESEEAKTAPTPTPTLEDIAEEIFSDSMTSEIQVSEPNTPRQGVPEGAVEQAKPEEGMTAEEDFFSDELLKVIEDAQSDIEQQKQTAQTPQPTQPEVPVPEPEAAAVQPAEPEQEDDSLKMLRALLAAQGVTEQELQPEQEPEAATAAEQVQPETAADSVQAELETLRQKIAELEAKAAGSELPSDASASKVQTSKVVRTAPELNPEFADKELETVTMDLPQEVQLESLVDLVGNQLGLNYMYDPTILKNQKVQLKIHGGKIKVKDVYSLLESVMKLKGFVMTRRDELVTIVKATDAASAIKQVDTVIRTPGEPIEAGDLIVSTIFQLENVPTSTAKNMLTSMNLGMNNGFQEIAETSTLIVTDYAYRMERIEKVLSIIDVPSQGKEYKFRTLVYLKPTELVPKLKELAGQLQGVTLQVSTPAAAQQTRMVTRRNPQTGKTERVPVPITTAKPAAAQTSSPDAVYIDTDDRTNRILIAGKPEEIALVNELIDALDVPQHDLKIVREYIIQYVEATEVVNVLNELGLASVSVSTPSAATTTSQRQPGRTPQPAVAAAAAATSTQTGTEQPYVSVRAATNSLLVNATAEQHRAIELVIAHVDVVQKDQRTIRQYEIQYVGAQDIIDTLTDLGIITPESTASSSRSQQTTGRTSGRTAARTTPQAVQPAAEGAAVPQALPTAEGGTEVSITAEQPQISILETTNSLLVYATPRQHDAIALVIAHADRQLTADSTPYVVYSLENQNPTDLAAVLNDLIQQTVKEINASRTSTTSKVGTSTAGAAAAASATPNLPTLEETDIKIIADEPSYSLIVYANKRNQQWVSELIKELDEYRPQVLLDCTLVEISQNEKFEYDLDIITQTSSGTDLRSGTTLVGQLLDFDTDQYVDARATTSGDPVFKTFFNSGRVQALLTAIETKGYGRVMARPKILVNDNQEGEIKTENQTSIAQQKSQTIPGTGGTENIVTEDVSFSEYTSGVTLTIKPHISKGDMLRLEIGLNRRDFDFTRGTEVTVASKTYPRPPDLLSTDVVTVATVPDGATIILGGLETIKQSKGNSKIPILGDLPLVGSLFRGVTDTGEQGKLYVFVKANILRPSDQAEGLEDIRRVSGKYRGEFEEMEERFQKLEDVPWVKPKPMHPERVLEED